MKYVVISNFGGIYPRFAEHTLDSYQATIAHNVRLRDGRLEAWREKCVFAEAYKAAKTLHVLGCHALLWSGIVHVATTMPDWKRFYVTGHAAYPEVVTMSCDGSLSYSRLGIPAPETAPYISGASSCERDSDARSYVYTYVNHWGEESAPSEPSNVITVSDGTDVTLTNIAQPDIEYDIDHINIYRAVTAIKTYGEQQQKFNTSYLFVDSIPLGSTTYIDKLSMTGLGSALETLDVLEPPAALTNLVAFDDVVRLAGTVKNKIYFSEYFQLYNWPVRYEMTLDDTIIHMRAQGQRLFITTDTVPYIVDAAKSTVIKCGTPMPDIACQYAHTTLMIPQGLVYVSPKGLVLLKATGDVSILTKAWYSPEEWVKIAPETARLGYHEGYIFCVTDRVSLLIDIDSSSYGDMKGTELTTISDKPIDMFQSSTGVLHMLEDNKVWTWAQSETLRPFYWESRQLTGKGDQAKTLSLVADKTAPLGTTWSPASAKVKTDHTTFTLIAPLGTYTRTVVDDAWFRLPRIGRNLWYKVRFEGVMPVEFFTMGTSNFTLNVGT